MSDQPDAPIMPPSQDGDAPPPRFMLPSEIREREERARRFQLLVSRLLFLGLLILFTVLTVASQASSANQFSVTTVVVLFVISAAVGITVILVDTRTPNKRLSLLVGVYLGVCAGLIGTLVVSELLDVITDSWEIDSESWRLYFGLSKVVVGIVLCYLAVSVVLTTKDDFRLVIPYVEFAKQVRGVRPMLLDTSILIDGRIEAYGDTGFLDAPVIVPQFVLYELQTLADSSDKLKRAKGRRGLTLVNRLQANPYFDISIDQADMPAGMSVDRMLVQLAAEQQLRIVTTDYNLNKLAQISGVTVLNINDLVGAMKTQATPGEQMAIDVIKRGESPSQGVGYLPDGTMVVIEDAAGDVGKRVQFTVTNSLQTTAGRMVFGRREGVVEDAPPAPAPEPPDEHDEPPAEDGDGSSVASAATNQPRVTERPDRGHRQSSRRNPRR